MRKKSDKFSLRNKAVVVGREAFEKISAVEGIVESNGARRRSIEFDRRGLTAGQRRREIMEAFAPKAPAGNDDARR